MEDMADFVSRPFANDFRLTLLQSAACSRQRFTIKSMQGASIPAFAGVSWKQPSGKESRKKIDPSEAIVDFLIRGDYAARARH